MTCAGRTQICSRRRSRDLNGRHGTSLIWVARGRQCPSCFVVFCSALQRRPPHLQVAPRSVAIVRVRRCCMARRIPPFFAIVAYQILAGSLWAPLIERALLAFAPALRIPEVSEYCLVDQAARISSARQLCGVVGSAWRHWVRWPSHS